MRREIARRNTRKGKDIYKRRKETAERNFADAKQLHGHRYIRMRGLLRAQEQGLLSAACQNMKKMALLLCKPDEKHKSFSETLIALLIQRCFEFRTTHIESSLNTAIRT